jgi:hypothetical protein
MGYNPFPLIKKTQFRGFRAHIFGTISVGLMLGGWN